jgi:hypothetical protein
MNIGMKMLLFVICIDAFLFLGQMAIIGINPEASLGSLADYNKDSHILTGYNIGNASASDYQLASANQSNLESLFPASQKVEDTNTGFFADIYNTMKGWFFSVIPLGVFLQVIGAPYFFLKAILPSAEYQSVIFIIGALWYVFSIFALIFVLLGRES